MQKENSIEAINYVMQKYAHQKDQWSNLMWNLQLSLSDIIFAEAMANNDEIIFIFSLFIKLYVFSLTLRNDQPRLSSLFCFSIDSACVCACGGEARSDGVVVYQWYAWWCDLTHTRLNCLLIFLVFRVILARIYRKIKGSVTLNSLRGDYCSLSQF